MGLEQICAGRIVGVLAFVGLLLVAARQLYRNINKVCRSLLAHERHLFFLGGISWLGMFLIGAINTAAGEEEKYEFAFYLVSVLPLAFFGLPKFAEWWLPIPKKIAELSNQELFELIEKSHPENDWKIGAASDATERFYAQDRKLKLRLKHGETGVQCEDFKSSWANCFPNQHAVGYWHDLTYDGDLIHRFILVGVDGGRALLPVPNWGTQNVEPISYRVAQIFNERTALEDYMTSSGLSVSSS